MVPGYLAVVPGYLGGVLCYLNLVRGSQVSRYGGSHVWGLPRCEGFPSMRGSQVWGLPGMMGPLVLGVPRYERSPGMGGFQLWGVNMCRRSSGMDGLHAWWSPGFRIFEVTNNKATDKKAKRPKKKKRRRRRTLPFLRPCRKRLVKKSVSVVAQLNQRPKLSSKLSDSSTLARLSWTFNWHCFYVHYVECPPVFWLHVNLPVKEDVKN